MDAKDRRAPLVRRSVVWFMLAGVGFGGLGVTAGLFVAESRDDGEAATVTVTRSQTRTVASGAVGVPDAVELKRLRILRAAEARNYDELAKLADPTFKYTFGSPASGGPAEFWRRAEQQGQQPLESLMTILRLPYTLSRGLYVWPFAYDKTSDEITQHEADLLTRIPPDGTTVGPEGYLGWRAGILPDGRWIYFVAGD
jgi:hypothetical protein